MSVQYQQREKQKIARHFDAAAEGYDKAAVMQAEIGQRLFERLDYVDIAPEMILDLGCGTGKWTRALAERYKKSQVVGIDLSARMIEKANKDKPFKLFKNNLRFQVGDIYELDIKTATVDVVYSNFAFQWCSDIQAVFNECKRVLKPGGLLMFTMPGPDTLKELKNAFATLDNYAHTNQFPDMHDVGDALVKSGYFQPVMDMDMLTQPFADCRSLLYSIKKTGAGTVLNNPRQGLMGKRMLSTLATNYESFRDSEGQLPLTYEVIYGHAWAPDRAVGAFKADNVIPIKMRQG